MLNHVHSHRLFLFILHPAFYFSPITPGENKINFLFHSLIMAALFLSSAWTSVYLQGLFFNRTVRVYKVKEFPLPSLLGYCWNGCKMGGKHIGYCKCGRFQPIQTERWRPPAMTEFRGLETSQCHLIILRPKSLILPFSVFPLLGTFSESWLTHRNLMFRKSLSCPYKQFHRNNLAAGTRGSFKFCSAWFTIKI